MGLDSLHKLYILRYYQIESIYSRFGYYWKTGLDTLDTDKDLSIQLLAKHLVIGIYSDTGWSLTKTTPYVLNLNSYLIPMLPESQLTQFNLNSPNLHQSSFG